MWIRRFIWGFLLVFALPLAAQDGLNLPSALYVLTAEGHVDRYGLGAEGVRTVTPDSDFVIDFGLAPDGTWLAYRTDLALILYNIYTEERVQIDGALAGVPSLRGQGDTIAWSPTGDALAVTTLDGGRVYVNAEDDPMGNAPFEATSLTEGPFTQWVWSPDGRYLAGEVAEDIWWIYQRDSKQMILHSAITSSRGLAWYSPDKIVFAPAEGGLRLMDLAAANAQTVLLDDTWTYALPYMMPDGTVQVFGRQKDSEDVPEGYARLFGLPTDERRIDSLGDFALDLTDLSWAPGGELMVAFRGGALALVNPTTGEGFPLPVNGVAALTWGPEPLPTVEGLTLPAAGYFLAADENDTVQVWRLPPDGSAPVTVTSETEPVSSFALAPNNQMIAYSSGSRMLVQRLNGSAPVKLADLSSTDPAYPSFSPDSQRIAYGDGGIWMVPAGGGDVRQVIANDMTEGFERHFSRPRFAPNVEALLVQVERPEITVPGVVDDTSGELTEIAVEQQAQWLSDGRIALFGLTKGARPGGLSIAGLGTLTQPAPILPEILPVESLRELGTNRLRMVLPRQVVGPETLRVASLDVSSWRSGPGLHRRLYGRCPSLARWRVRCRIPLHRRPADLRQPEYGRTGGPGRTRRHPRFRLGWRLNIAPARGGVLWITAVTPAIGSQNLTSGNSLAT